MDWVLADGGLPGGAIPAGTWMTVEPMRTSTCPGDSVLSAVAAVPNWIAICCAAVDAPVPSAADALGVAAPDAGPTGPGKNVLCTSCWMTGTSMMLTSCSVG